MLKDAKTNVEYIRDILIYSVEYNMHFKKSEEFAFSLSTKPLPGTVKLYINGVSYSEKEGYFRIDRENNLLVWMATDYRGGFDLKPFWTYIAEYEADRDDIINLYNIEKAINALILVNPDLLRTNFEYTRSKEQDLLPYLAAQIHKGNLTRERIIHAYPDLNVKDGRGGLTLDEAIESYSGRKDYMLLALNILIMTNPILLHSNASDIQSNIFMVYTN